MTLKELLGLIAFVAIGLAGLLTGPPLAWCVIGALVIVYLALLINSLVAHGSVRAFSIGFLVPAFVYFGFLCITGIENALQPNLWANLPTTRWLQNVVSPAFPDQIDLAVLEARVTSARSVMPLGHLLIATMLGLVGGYYGRWVASAPPK